MLALLLPVTPRPVLAPLTAILVAQVSLYQTLKNAVRRVASVVAGVLVAVALSAAFGFTWWSLGITIVAGLTLGYALHLGDHILEVPISAMLILSVGTTRAAATGRIIETLFGAGAGMLAGLAFARPKVQPAEEAMTDLCRKMADLLERMAGGLVAGSVTESAVDWLVQSRALGGEIRRVDDALRQAAESVRLNPRGAGLSPVERSLRVGLETLEHAAITLRGLARSLADSARLPGDDSPVRDQDIRQGLASVLEQFAAAVRTYGLLAQAYDQSGRDRLTAQLQEHLAAAHDRQDQLSELLGTDPAERPVGWPLRGELISHLDRLRTELEAGLPADHQLDGQVRSWRRVLQGARRGSDRAGAGS